MSPAASTRWSPTPEQLMILEELYRRGVRTPKASQIQKITAHLSSYGKIQGKNVFYWFQNHKARDRQKLRKKIDQQMYQQNLFLLHNPYLYPTPFTPPQQYDHQPHHFLHDTPSASSALEFTSLHPQGIRACQEEAPESVMKSCTEDLPSYCSTRKCGQNFMLVADVGLLLDPYSKINKPKLETLELFPLRSTSAKDLNKTDGEN